MGLLRNVLGSMKDGASITKATVFSNPATNTAETLSLRLSVILATTHDPSSLPPPRHLSSLLSLSSSAPRSTASAAIEALISRRYLELVLTASRVLGHFLFSLSCRLERENAAHNIPSLLNSHLLSEIDALLDLLEEMARFPYSNSSPDGENNILVSEVIRLVAEDYSVVVDNLASRIADFNQRLDCLSFGDSVELVCALRRVDNCREIFPLAEKAPAVRLSQLARRLMEEVRAVVSQHMEEKPVVNRGLRVGGSARFETRANLARFLSNRSGFLLNHTAPS